MTITSKIFYNFVKQSYNKVYEIEDKEEVYRKKDKLVVVIKDEEIGEQIYDIIKTLKRRADIISSKKVSLEIDKCFSDKQDKIQIFSANVCFDFEEREWKDFSKVEKLQEIVSLVADMEDKGYILNSSKFENETCNSISSFFSFFEFANEETKNSKGCLIKYIHYVLSDGGSLEEYYGRIVKDNIICKVSEFPYALPVIKMCYNYFVTGSISDDIYKTLLTEKFEETCDTIYYSNYLLVSNSDLKDTLKLMEDNDEYAIYDGNIKIYHSMTYEFERFLRDDIEFLKNNMEEIIEQIDSIIINFKGNIIGYKFTRQEIQDTHSIFHKKFKSQSEILEFISKIYNYVFTLNEKSLIKERSILLKIDESLLTDSISITNKENNYFDIEKFLIYTQDSDISFKITKIKEVFNLYTSDENVLKNQITSIFFKLYLTYLNQKYGNINNEEQFLEKAEVRYLNPVLANSFINYALGIYANNEYSTSQFFNFLFVTKISMDDDYFYDSIFEYNPLNVPFFFDYEAEMKYGIRIKKGMEETLSDGRKLITFKKKKQISDLKNKKESLQKDILKKLGDIEDEHVKIVGISEIIYSKDINHSNMYKLVGYVTEAVNGRSLTDDVLRTLNNKDLLKVAGYLFFKFDSYYIPLDTIWMDNDFVFYINIFDERFQIKKSEYEGCKISFANWIEEYLLKIGCSPYNFIDVDFSCYNKNYLLAKAMDFDAYCDEHNVYYHNHGKCPICQETKYLIGNNDFAKIGTEVLEDLYAKHYNINETYNLKIYKKSYVDMVNVEKNLDNIINIRLLSKEMKLGQDCFVPYKKAINSSNNEVVGYVYAPVEFNDRNAYNHIGDELKDSQNLKNLPRLMSLIRLMLQIKEVTKNGLGFIENPFSNVFLSKYHKKQVQILNIDFLSKDGSVEDTLKWTCEYVCNVLALDDSIELYLDDKSSTNIDYLLAKLQTLSKVMTKYCSIHGIYYINNKIFCPKCMSKEQIEKIESEYVDKSKFTNKKADNQGGESYIYYCDDVVVKVFKMEENDSNYAKKLCVLGRIFDKKRILERINNQHLKYKYIIPQMLLIDNKSNNVFGYTMKRVIGMPISSLKDKKIVEDNGITMKDVFEILITVGKGIETLHANNIYIGDLNGQNILFDMDKNVYFLDFDGMGFDEDIVPEFFTDGYIDPLSQNNITMKDDWYSFAVQAFHYLTFTHPFNGVFEGNERSIVLLDIPDMMERRLSLLGNHGMEPPEIARKWDWMRDELKKAFFDIFEGDNRESIVPHLISQYEELYENEIGKVSGKSIRISSKFRVEKLNLFDSSEICVINHYSAICKKGCEYWITILVNDDGKKIKYNINYSDFGKINKILLSENKKIAFLICTEKIVAIDLKTNIEIYSEEISGMKDVIVNGNTLYFSGISNGEYIIFQRDFTTKGEVKKEKIKFLPEQQTKCLLVKFNSKFVIVKQALNHSDEIYCNSEKLCNIDCYSEYSDYKIVYDEATKWWIVINSEGNGVIIKANGEYKKISIKKDIDCVNIERVEFNKGNIYIPSMDYLYIVNTNNDQLINKKMECYGIMTPKSQLYDINKDGFNIITDNILYEVRRV